MITKKDLEEVAKFFEDKLVLKLAPSVECILLAGSFHRGDYNPDRPDVNFLLFFKPFAAAHDLLSLGEIYSETKKHFAPRFNIVPAFQPFRFYKNNDKNSNKIFLNSCVLNMIQKDDPLLPFGVDWTFLSGIKAANKVLYGTNPLENFDININSEKVKMVSKMLLPMILTQLSRAPLVYFLPEDANSLYDESMCAGKCVVYVGVEAMLEDEDFRKGKHLKLIADKDAMINFYKEKYDDFTASLAEKILLARKNYAAWNNNPDKAIEVYSAAFTFTNIIFQRLINSNK